MLLHLEAHSSSAACPFDADLRKDLSFDSVPIVEMAWHSKCLFQGFVINCWMTFFLASKVFWVQHCHRLKGYLGIEETIGINLLLQSTLPHTSATLLDIRVSKVSGICFLKLVWVGPVGVRRKHLNFPTIYPPEAPEKSYLSNRKVSSLPAIIFQGRTVKLRGGGTEELRSYTRLPKHLVVLWFPCSSLQDPPRCSSRWVRHFCMKIGK